MSGLYCETCKYWQKMPIGDNEGECGDISKIIFFQFGQPRNERPITSHNNYCFNWSKQEDA